MTDRKSPVLVCLTDTGVKRALDLRDTGMDIRIHGLKDRTSAQDVDAQFDKTIAHIQSLWLEGQAIVGICASGILIRAVAPILSDKRAEPPLLSMSEDGKVVIPLLGGHHGANALATELAEAQDAIAAVTTSGETRLGFSLDEPPHGWLVANPAAVKPVTAALLAGDTVSLKVEAGHADWLPADLFKEDGRYSVLITDRDIVGDDTTLVIHPPVLHVGVGCERGAPEGPLTEMVLGRLKEAGLSPLAVANMGSLDIKVDEGAMHAVQKALNVDFRVMDAPTLDQVKDRLANPSDVVFAETGCHGVAEGAALTLAGESGELILPKIKDAKHTCAIARSKDGGNRDAGRARGCLYVVGIGPGSPEWRNGLAAHAILDADDIVGYQLYLDLAADLIGKKPTHHSELGEEEARARKAIELAATGRKVALVCSGDPGIYALATLVFELIDRHDNRDWNGLDVITVPGVSAFQAAAARIGAPVNHDFCTISLSDLLTPRDAILKRLEAAGAGDFVISFYNPQSKRRRTLLPEAQKILLKHRPETTPVVIARNLGRDDEAITITTLKDFDPEMVDMLSLVMVGSSETRAAERGGRTIVYTPRGYAKKMVD